MTGAYRTLQSLVVIAALLVVVGCEKGSAEKAGEAIDRAGERVRDAVDPAGPAEKAGRSIDRATDGR